MNKNDHFITSNQRIEYIDAIKGFLILSVVMCHVAGYCMGIQDDIPSFHPIMLEIRNPPFFFISGFFAYKATNCWNGNFTIHFLKKKMQAILWPSILFLTVLLYIHPSFNGRTFLYDNIKDLWFYWYTFALTIYFIFYSFIKFVLYKIKCNETIENVVLISCGLLSYLLFSVQSVYDLLPVPAQVKLASGMIYWGFFLFFILGILTKKYHDKFTQLIANQYFACACLFTFILFNIFHQPLIDTYYNLFRIVTYLTGIIIVYIFFKDCHLPQTINKFFVYIGKKTLDIYLIHYFLLPLALYPNTAFFRETPIPILEFMTTTAISIGIIALSLLISRILRISTISTLLFFGERNKE